MKCVISVLGKDRSGVVAMDPAVADFNTVQERLAADGERLSMQVLIQREDVFQAMYEI